MAVQGGPSAKTNDSDHPHSSNLEFLTRLAEELRSKSGSDLPLSCFVEQVKMQLAHGSTPENLIAEADRAARHSAPASSDCFKAWAMPEDVSALLH